MPPRTARHSEAPSLFDLLLPQPPEPEPAPPAAAPAPASPSAPPPPTEAAPPAPSAPGPVLPLRRTPRPSPRPRPEGQGRSYFGQDHHPAVPSYGRVDRLDGRRCLLAALYPRHIRESDAHCVFVDTLSGRDVRARWSDAAGVWVESA